jgi:opacity protein-like surface antigen
MKLFKKSWLLATAAITLVSSLTNAAIAADTTHTGGDMMSMDNMMNNTYVTLRVATMFADEQEIKLDGTTAIGDPTVSSGITASNIDSSAATLMSNGNNSKYLYSHGLGGAIAVGTMLDNLRLEAELLAYSNKAKENENSKIYETLSLEGVTLSGSALTPNPTVSNEDGNRLVAAMVNAQFGIPLGDMLCVNIGGGIGRYWNKAFGVTTKGFAWQGRADLEVMASDNLMVFLGARYLSPFSSEVKDVPFVATVTGTGTVTLPVKLKAPIAAWEGSVGVKLGAMPMMMS